MTAHDLRPGSRGFALIVVLWICVLVGLIVVHLIAAGRSELRIAGNLAANAAAQAAADGAVYRGIFNLLDPRPEERWALDSTTHEIAIGDSRVMVRLDDEAARINPNVASLALLKALLAATANDREQAEDVAAAIAEWVGAKKGPQPLSGINPDYRAAGLQYGPPGEPLQSIDELARVRGMTPALLSALRPHLSLFAPAVPNAERADPIVAQAMAEAARLPAPGNLLPQTIAGNPALVTARITAAARGPGNAAASRVAIARVGPAIPHGYVLLAWEDNAE
jgi:general secretion pathway protein K